jgi:hypothetical protein
VINRPMSASTVRCATVTSFGDRAGQHLRPRGNGGQDFEKQACFC